MGESKASSSASRPSRAGGRGKKAGARKRRAARGARRASAAATKPLERLELSGKAIAEVRDALTQGIIRPLNLVMLTRDRIEEAVEDAVSRGRMTADDARDLVQSLLSRGQRQTNDVLRDLEQLLDRTGRGEAATPRAAAPRRRRTAARGPRLPISGYDDLTAAQVQAELEGLSPAQLRKVRDYERRHANRKSVLTAIESRLR